jgi:hypothetical protein
MKIAQLFGLWALFYAGFAASLLLQAQTSVSSSSNSLANVWEWLKIHSVVIGVRAFLCAMTVPLMVHYIPQGLGLPIWAVYGIAGFLADTLLDKVLFIFGQRLGMKVEVPQVAPSASVLNAQPAPNQEVKP